MAATSSETWARRIGLAIGLLLALAAVLSWRIPAGGPGLGADARFVATPPGELTLEPAGTFLSARALRPGGKPAGGRLLVRNLTGKAVDLRVRGLPSNRDLDRALRVRLELGDSTLFEGGLGELRSWTPGARLARGEQRTVSARAWLPAALEGGYQGTSVDVTVELRADG